MENNYTYAKDLIPITNRLHRAFIKHPNLKPKDYVLDGKSALDFYLLTRGISKTLTITITDNNTKETVLKYLSEMNIDPNYISILKRQPKAKANDSLNLSTKDKDGNTKLVNIVSREKLFINIDTYKGITADERDRAINKLRKQVDFKKLNKLIKLQRGRGVHISKQALDYIAEYKRGYPKVRNDERTNIIKEVQRIIQADWNIQIGGIAVEEFSEIPRASFDLDLFSPEYQINWIVNRLKEHYEVKDGRLSRKPEEKEFTVFSKINGEHNKSTILLISDKNKKRKFSEFKIDVNHMVDDSIIKSLKDKKLVEERLDKGLFLCPEGLIASKLISVFHNFSGRKPNVSKTGKLGQVKYNERIVKDILDIDNLTMSNKIDKNKIHQTIIELNKAGYEKLDLTKLPNLQHIINNDKSFEKDYHDIMKVNTIDTLPFLVNDKNITEYCEFLIKKEQTIKKAKEIKI